MCFIFVQTGCQEGERGGEIRVSVRKTKVVEKRGSASSKRKVVKK